MTDPSGFVAHPIRSRGACFPAKVQLLHPAGHLQQDFTPLMAEQLGALLIACAAVAAGRVDQCNPDDVLAAARAAIA